MTSYHQAGISDVSDFYQEKFAFEADHNFTPRRINFYSLYYLKRVWIYAQIAPNSRVLDVGCGSGAMACLKNRGCSLYGVDFSAKALEIAERRNGYDATFSGDILDCPFAEGSFDYVVSVDVFGHIPFEDKDRVIAKLKRMLKPGGVMLHGIECAAIDYDAMSSAELARFVAVDGHVGMEDRASNMARFGRFFDHVQARVRYDLIKNAEDYPKQHGAYGNHLPQPLAAYLATLTAEEQEIFDICGGMATLNLERAKLGGEGFDEGFLLLAASDQPLPEPDWRFEESTPLQGDALPLQSEDLFLRGWHRLEHDGVDPYRWSQRDGYLYLQGQQGRQLKLSLFSHHPHLQRLPITVHLIQVEDGALLQTLELRSHQPVEVTIAVPLDRPDYLVRLHVATTWIPRYTVASEDVRELGVGVKWVYFVEGENATCVS